MTAAFATPISTTMVSAAGIGAGPATIEWPVTIATDDGLSPGRQGNSRAGRHRERRGDTWNDLEGNARGVELERLLGAAAEEQRIATLESDDAMTGSGRRHKLVADHILRGLRTVAGLADVDEPGLGITVRKHAVADQVVVVDLGRACEQSCGPQRQQPRIARARPRPGRRFPAGDRQQMQRVVTLPGHQQERGLLPRGSQPHCFSVARRQTSPIEP